MALTQERLPSSLADGPELAEPDLSGPTLAACSTLVKGVCRDVGLRNSQI